MLPPSAHHFRSSMRLTCEVNQVVDGGTCIICIAVILLFLGLGYWTIYNLYHSENEIATRIKVIIIAFIFLNLVGAASRTSVCFLCHKPSKSASHSIVPLISLLSQSYLYSLDMLALLFITRLRSSFKNTDYELSNCSYCIIISLCLFNMTVTTTYTLNEIIVGNLINPIWFSIGILTLSLLHIIIGVSTLCLFLSKLNKLAMKMRHSQISKDIVGVNGRQEPLIELMSKYTILVCLALITTAATMTPLFYAYINNIDIRSNYRMYLLTFTLVRFDSFINMICVILQMNFAVKYYHKLCGCCHTGCRLRFEHYTIQKMVKQYNPKRPEIEMAEMHKNSMNMNGSDQKSLEIEVSPRAQSGSQVITYDDINDN